jgi:hypothetical protein
MVKHPLESRNNIETLCMSLQQLTLSDPREKAKMKKYHGRGVTPGGKNNIIINHISERAISRNNEPIERRKNEYGGTVIKHCKKKTKLNDVCEQGISQKNEQRKVKRITKRCNGAQGYIDTNCKSKRKFQEVDLPISLPENKRQRSLGLMTEPNRVEEYKNLSRTGLRTRAFDALESGSFNQFEDLILALYKHKFKEEKSYEYCRDQVYRGLSSLS